jgi:predicted ribosomally synthesized peptide with nif11-like leader
MKIDEWADFIHGLAGDTQAEAILAARDFPKIIALAKSKGFTFTEQDLADAGVGELSDAALERVAGGPIQIFRFVRA